MIRFDHPLAWLLVFVPLAMGLVVCPYLKTQRFRVTAGKAAAVLIAVGIAVYSGNLALVLVFLWPLSFVWFPEYWGSYTGLLRGQYIDEKSPPILISLMGWFFLVAFPLVLHWMTNW